MTSQLDYLLSPFDSWRHDPATEEMCVNAPGEVWVWQHGRFTRHDVSDADADWIEELAWVAGAQRRIDVGTELGKPLLTTDLPGEGRIQVVLPPCVAVGYPSVTFRRGSLAWPTIDELAAQGLFSSAQTKARERRISAADQQLCELLKAGDVPTFLKAAVRAKKTIVGVGETASGKTHFAKACINEIDRDERLITIENAPELRRIPHPNRVQMFYDVGSGITGLHLVEAALRMRIGRLIFQEMRSGEEALAVLIALQTGHAGTVTTIHAPSAATMFDRWRDMLRQTSAGAAATGDEINQQLRSLVDVVIHFDHEGGVRRASEIWFRAMELS